MVIKVKRVRNRKNVNVNQRNRLYNLYYVSTLKTLYKKLKLLIEKNSQDEKLKQVYSYYISIIDKAIRRNAIHKKYGARRKSKIAKLLKSKLNRLSI